MRPRRRQTVLTGILLLVLSMAACDANEEVAPAAVTPPVVAAAATPEATTAPEVIIPQPANSLIVCLGQEPVTLYRPAASDPAAVSVLQAIYENDVVQEAGVYRPQGLAKLPGLDDGDATVRTVLARAGDEVATAQGDVAPLQPGMTVVNSGGEEVVFSSLPIPMNQMVVDFTMRQRVWSDGTPVTSADSLFAFEVAPDALVHDGRQPAAYTTSYEATGNLSLRWIGVPGYMDAGYFLNFWPPLPRHAWQEIPPAELPENPASSRRPIGDGPFRVATWDNGDLIRLERNPHYYRAGEGWPALDSVSFRFIPDMNRLASQLLAGECDVATHDGLDASLAPFFDETEAQGLLSVHYWSEPAYEHIVFGIDSATGFGDSGVRPDWFENVQVRQALTMCFDRQGLVDDVLFGRGEVLDSYLPAGHKLLAAELSPWPYDVETASALLAEAGFVDNNGDGIREDPGSGEDFRVTLITGEASLTGRALAERFRDDMRACGLVVEPLYLPRDQWLARSASGLLFGRRFDLAHLSWPVATGLVGNEPPCERYAAWQIPGPPGELNPKSGQPFRGWGLANVSGWVDGVYDAACRAALNARPGSARYVDNHELAQRIVAENLPFIPLFSALRLTVAKPGVQNIKPDSGQGSELWNIFEWRWAEEGE